VKDIASVPPNFTLFAPVKPLPLIVTVSPPLVTPDDGQTEEIVGVDVGLGSGNALNVSGKV